ncbi:hypothetical protein LMG27198_28130 [Methylocystis echinoides]|uniref:Uncharacterized protein n=1 Tax=Methylocystis echinoides TaxID=29468 RepID=A0A9W6GVH6_9HYPH|nr:hypothetical protein LMG27198_28130 [Methylocystis echinoides]
MSGRRENGFARADPPERAVLKFRKGLYLGAAGLAGAGAKDSFGAAMPCSGSD